MKRLFWLLGLSSCLSVSPAHAITIDYDFSGLSVALPDGDPTGLADLRNISTSITSIDDISVSLNVSGTWNGDIYATLQHDSGFAVLLNRVGRTGNTGIGAFGSGDDGFDVIFNDSPGAIDIHGFGSGGGLVSGTFGSDGREVDPDLVLDASPRTALLDNFLGLDPNGDWTLFLADLSGGDQHVLQDWSMAITGTEGGMAVPDGGSSALILTFALAGLLGFKHAKRK